MHKPRNCNYKTPEPKNMKLVWREGDRGGERERKRDRTIILIAREGLMGPKVL